MRASIQFAPKLLIRDVLAADVVEWQTEEKAVFQWERIRFERVWLQGFVKGPQELEFVLDDGTGQLAIAATGLGQSQKCPELSAGDYVVVIGRLHPGDPETASPESFSVKANKVGFVRGGSIASKAWGKEVSDLKERVYSVPAETLDS